MSATEVLSGTTTISLVQLFTAEVTGTLAELTNDCD